MSPTEKMSKLPDIIEKHENDLLTEWIDAQMSVVGRSELMKDSELRDQSARFLNILKSSLRNGVNENIQTGNWEEMRNFLATISASRAVQGFTPTETANFIFSIKRTFFDKISESYLKDAPTLATEITRASTLLDNFGLFTMESFIKVREKIINRQQEEMMELSTPVVKLWDGILALPMIGTLDSQRTQVVMETLLQKIVDTGSEIAILDITGVPTVDTLVAQHLLKTVSAARLMGADCIISGIRPQIAQTMVHLGVDLSQVITKSSLADAFLVAMSKLGKKVGAGLSNSGKYAARGNSANADSGQNGAKEQSWNGYQ